MPLFTEKHLDEAILGIWKMDETELQMKENLLLLPLYSQELEQFKSHKRKFEFLAVRLLLQTLIPINTPQISYYADGRPFLKNSTWHISISHTGSYAAVILHPSRMVAIDIEQRREKILRLCPKFLDPLEIDFIQTPQILNYALICWSAKESMYKIIPENEIDFKNHLHIHPFEVQNQGLLKSYENKSEFCQQFSIYYYQYPEFVMTWIIDSQRH